MLANQWLTMAFLFSIRVKSFKTINSLANPCNGCLYWSFVADLRKRWVDPRTQ